MNTASQIEIAKTRLEAARKENNPDRDQGLGINFEVVARIKEN